MKDHGDGRLCRCGTRLAKGNRTSKCSSCQKKSADHLVAPPVLPRSFWDEPKMQRALEAHDIGQVLLAYRTHPDHPGDITQATAAGWLNMSQPSLSRLEAGKPFTKYDQLIQIAHVLGIPEDLLWFKMPPRTSSTFSVKRAMTRPRTEPTNQNQTPQASSSALLPVVVNGRLVMVPVDADTLLASAIGADSADGLGYPAGELVSVSEWEAMPLSRRSLLVRGIAAATLPGLGLDEAEPFARAIADPHRYLDTRAVTEFSHQIDTAMANDGAVGPRKTLPVMLNVLDTIKHCARQVRPDIRRALLSVGAQGAEFCGWLYRDIRQPAIAGFWHDRGMEWAQEAGDTAMQGYLLLKKSQMAYDERDPLRVLTLAQAAQQGPWQLPIKVRAEVTQQEALGLAMIGEPMGAVERKLEEAHQFLNKASGEEHRGLLGAYFNRHTLRLRNASCFTEAGKPGRAAELFKEVLAENVLSHRDAGYFRARRAAALALSGEPDEAATVGLESAKVGKATQSQRTLHVLGEVVEILKPWRGRPAPRELREALQA